jgi:lipopolysaccharide/colanic/teichoic acid biosynthesis glycosyltransferase
MSNKIIIKDRQERNEAPGMRAGSGIMLSTGAAGALSGPFVGANLQPLPSRRTAEASEPALALPSETYLVAKRLFDVAVAALALTVFGLALPALALIIKLDSPGPVFFSQERVGLNRRRSRSSFDGTERRQVLQPGRPFRVLKLRTMGVNAEAGGPQWATQNDVRVTRVGRFLRKTRLDEVPQFLNVLRCEMSLIGPRPERLVFVRQLEKVIPQYHERLLVLPGITGLAQVINGYDDGVESVQRKVELDRQYIRRAGFRQDGKILLSTVGVVLKGEGAR